MNRELKFKAWDSNLNQMITDAISLETTAIKQRWNLQKAKEVIWLQFTGFKDSQGKDIYEGDILSDEVMTDEGLKMSLQQVFWDDKKGCWMLDFSHKQNKSSSDMLYSQLLAYDYKIVGNIYENPLNIES